MVDLYAVPRLPYASVVANEETIVIRALQRSHSPSAARHRVRACAAGLSIPLGFERAWQIHVWPCGSVLADDRRRGRQKLGSVFGHSLDLLDVERHEAPASRREEFDLSRDNGSEMRRRYDCGGSCSLGPRGWLCPSKYRASGSNPRSRASHREDWARGSSKAVTGRHATRRVM